MVSAHSEGFSLPELTLALAITLIIGLIGFQLFRQNERTFREQAGAMEVQQNARAVILQIADEVRRAGQGVPIYAATFDTAPNEASTAVLSGSDSTHLRVRQGFSNVETQVVAAPLEYLLNVSLNVPVADTSFFSTALGTSTPHGRFVYVWGAVSNSCWSWIRAELITITAVTNSLTVVPRQLGDGCRTVSDTVRFTSAQVITLEEAVSIHFNAGSIWRSTASDMTVMTAPVWSPASELGRDFRDLTFTYYDEDDHILVPSTFGARMKVARIDVAVQTQNSLLFKMRGIPPNIRIVSNRY